VREIVIVIADLYLPLGADAAASEAAAFAAVPGIEKLGRFGMRTRLAEGWRQWLARSVGCAELASVAPACIAAAVLPPAELAASQGVTSWIATPVQLTAGLAHVHLDPRGILRLPAADLAALAADFTTTFGASGFSLTPLPSGELLLRTPGIEPVETTEPARCAGAGVAQALPRGPAAAPLRRLIAEVEMWLHGLPLNEARRRRSLPPVSALWPWGATGRIVRAARCAGQAGLPAFGRDAWLEGLWHLQGSACSALPPHLQDVLATAGAERGVLVMEAGEELQRAEQGTLADALARLDARFVSPALQALRRGELSAVTLIVNDNRVRVQQHSLLKLWRRARAGLTSFA
jgi:hypothetical protein